MNYEDYFKKLLETGGEMPDIEGLLKFSELQRKRDEAKALERAGEEFGGYDIFSGARQKSIADITGRFAEASAAERANLLANIQQTQEAKKMQAAQILSQIAEAQKGREWGGLESGLGHYTPTGEYAWKTFGPEGRTGRTAWEEYLSGKEWEREKPYRATWEEQKSLTEKLAGIQAEATKKAAKKGFWDYATPLVSSGIIALAI